MPLTTGVAGIPAVPIVGAPLGGGPSTPALAAAISNAGGLGFVAAGYKSAATVEEELRELRALTTKPIGLNVFYPVDEAVDEGEIDAYAERMRGVAERYGVEPGHPRWTDDDWDAKLVVAARERPNVVSFTFGCPEQEVVEGLRESGCHVWCTVTSQQEAQHAAGAAVDALVVQGGEAGGHRGSFRDRDDAPLPLLALLESIRRVTDTPAHRGRRDRGQSRHRDRARGRRSRGADRIGADARRGGRHVGAAPRSARA